MIEPQPRELTPAERKVFRAAMTQFLNTEMARRLPDTEYSAGLYLLSRLIAGHAFYLEDHIFPSA